ncbi:MAG: SDR family NAD(P)-dependent oxidoreductase [Gemmataceae bacterium]
MANQIDLIGQTAIITGAARGIGLSIAKRLLDSGANLCLWDQDEIELNRAAGELNAKGKIHTARVDVTDYSSIDKATKEALHHFGKLHILVNNAGITGSNRPCWEISPDEWRRVVDVDLTGVFLCCRSVIPSMMSEGYGRIVNIASIAGKEGNPNAAHYSSAKAGVIGFTKSLGKELARSGILVNCVTPAVIETDIFKQMTPEHIQYMLSRIPMARFGQKEEAAALIAWLCSGDCSFSTGAVFDLSGGRATY